MTGCIIQGPFGVNKGKANARERRKREREREREGEVVGKRFCSGRWRKVGEPGNDANYKSPKETSL